MLTVRVEDQFGVGRSGQRLADFVRHRVGQPGDLRAQLGPGFLDVVESLVEGKGCTYPLFPGGRVSKA